MDYFPKTPPNFGRGWVTPSSLTNNSMVENVFTFEPSTDIFVQTLTFREFAKAVGAKSIRLSKSGKSIIMADSSQDIIGSVVLSKTLRTGSIPSSEELDTLKVGIFAVTSDDDCKACVFSDAVSEFVDL